jgi:hypothetical protein
LVSGEAAADHNVYRACQFCIDIPIETRKDRELTWGDHIVCGQRGLAHRSIVDHGVLGAPKRPIVVPAPSDGNIRNRRFAAGSAGAWITGSAGAWIKWVIFALIRAAMRSSGKVLSEVKLTMSEVCRKQAFML